MAKRAKVLLIAMDAGDRLLIETWLEAGILPNLKKLSTSGLVGDIKGLEGFYEGATWPSFYTGLNPAGHGIYNLNQLRIGSYDCENVAMGLLLKVEPFWEHLGKAGRRIAVFDIPLTGIRGPVNGIQTVEWGTHDRIYGFRTWPAPLKNEVLALFGRYSLTRPCDSFGPGFEEATYLKDLLRRCVEQKTDLTVHYLGMGGWDFFAQAFTEGHCIGHQYWHFHDMRYPQRRSPKLLETDDPVRDIYVAIDGALGRIFSSVQSDTTVIFVATHRMAHSRGVQFLMPQILYHIGVAAPIKSGLRSPSFPNEKLSTIIRHIWRKVPPLAKDKLWPVRCFLLGQRQRAAASIEDMYGLDPRKSKVFPVPSGDCVSGLRLNILGREPFGLVRDELEAKSLCDWMARDLGEITDLKSGKPIVKRVRRTSDLYRGAYLDCLPDIIVEWSDDQIVKLGHEGNTVRIGSNRIGLIEGIHMGRRTGDHRADGLFMAMGPGIKPRRMERPVSIMDFAPTITCLLGVEIGDTDGQVIPELVKSSA